MALTTTPTTSDSHPSGDGSQWPVLARLLDVSAQLHDGGSRSQQSAAGFVTYRFDPPQQEDPGRRSTVSRVVASAPAPESGHPGSPARPHIAERSRQNPRRRRSPILPDSDPFTIPRAGLAASFAPAARFFVLFALFTAAGTTVLTLGRRAERTPEPIKPVPTAATRLLEPQTANAPVDAPEQPAAAPTATGPLGGTSPRTTRRPEIHDSSTTEDKQSATAPPLAADQLATTDCTRLPQVQTRELMDTNKQPGAAADPPALAHLPGYILKAPTRQAQHEQNQSGLY